MISEKQIESMLKGKIRLKKTDIYTFARIFGNSNGLDGIISGLKKLRMKDKEIKIMLFVFNSFFASIDSAVERAFVNTDIDLTKLITLSPKDVRNKILEMCCLFAHLSNAFLGKQKIVCLLFVLPMLYATGLLNFSAMMQFLNFTAKTMKLDFYDLLSYLLYAAGSFLFDVVPQQNENTTDGTSVH